MMDESPDDDTIDAEVVEDDTAVALPAPVTPLAPLAPTEPVTDYTDDGVPTFDYVRDQIERRYGTSVGASELATELSPTTAELDKQLADREQAGRDRLEAIRRSMRGE
jgi:hypothetical protein